MSPRITLCGVRCALSGLMLVIGTAAFESLAHPVFSEDGEASAMAVDHVVNVRSLPDPAGAVDEIRVEEVAFGRRPWLPAALPGNYGNPFGQGEGLREQLLRDFGSAVANSAGASGADLERARRGDPRPGPGEPDPLNAAQAMINDVVENTLKLIRDAVFEDGEIVNFSLAGVDVNMTIVGGRGALIVDGFDLWPTIFSGSMNDPARGESATTTKQEGVRDPDANLGPAQALATAQGLDDTLTVPVAIAKIRDFLVDPMTIVAALGCLIVWFSFAMSSAIRERRRRRRSRRRRARAAA